MKAVIEIMNTRDQTASYVNSGDNVKLVVYPRIHMFPVDVSLISGIVKNGSLGYSLMNMPIEISVKINHTSKDSIHVEGDVDIKKLDFKIDFDKLRLYIRSSDHYNVIISVSASVREHTGLGMSTQILGGVYLCCARISNRDLKINDLYNIGLGHHSALGLNLLFNPGMIFEMGTTISKKGEGFIVNPKLSQEYESIANTVYKVNQFPFYSIIAIPKQASSVSDKYGDSFFNDTLPNKKVDSYRIVYNIYETLIPSIVESNYSVFINTLRQNIGVGIKQFEEKFQSKRTKEVLEQMRNMFDFAAVSSLGPSLYAFFDKDPAESLSRLDIHDYDFLVYDPSGKVKRKVGNSDTLLIASFAAMGKTTFAKQHPDIALDIESIHYARNYIKQHPNDEIAKGDKIWTDNPHYPDNYINEVLDNIGKYKVIFLTLGQSILSELDKRDLKYTILYPGPNRKQQILVDSRKRGNNEEFVDFLDALLSTPEHRLEFERFQHEHFEIIDDDTYMKDYLIENYYL